MARRTRLTLAGVAQHVIQRGNNRGASFFAEDDYRFYLDCLHDAATKYECLIHAYVLMTNHVHLLVTPGRPDGISGLMQHVGRRYVRHVIPPNGHFVGGAVQSQFGGYGAIRSDLLPLHRAQSGASRHRTRASGLPVVELSVSCVRAARQGGVHA